MQATDESSEERVRFHHQIKQKPPSWLVMPNVFECRPTTARPCCASRQRPSSTNSLCRAISRHSSGARRSSHATAGRLIRTRSVLAVSRVPTTSRPQLLRSPSQILCELMGVALFLRETSVDFAALKFRSHSRFQLWFRLNIMSHMNNSCLQILCFP